VQVMGTLARTLATIRERRPRAWPLLTISCASLGACDDASRASAGPSEPKEGRCEIPSDAIADEAASTEYLKRSDKFTYSTVWKFTTFEERAYYVVAHESVGMAFREPSRPRRGD
jgi:hypothetical protein